MQLPPSQWPSPPLPFTSYNICMQKNKHVNQFGVPFQLIVLFYCFVHWFFSCWMNCAPAQCTKCNTSILTYTRPNTTITTPDIEPIPIDWLSDTERVRVFLWQHLAIDRHTNSDWGSYGIVCDFKAAFVDVCTGALLRLPLPLLFFSLFACFVFNFLYLITALKCSCRWCCCCYFSCVLCFVVTSCWFCFWLARSNAFMRFDAQCVFVCIVYVKNARLSTYLRWLESLMNTVYKCPDGCVLMKKINGIWFQEMKKQTNETFYFFLSLDIS